MPNLSFEHLAIVLALGGCSKATPAADTVRTDPSASAPATQAVTPPPPAEVQQGAVGRGTATASALASPAPGGAASATELRKQKTIDPAKASCGAGSCTSEIKKK